jgi:hypothetical protein
VEHYLSLSPLPFGDWNPPPPSGEISADVFWGISMKGGKSKKEENVKEKGEEDKR